VRAQIVIGRIGSPSARAGDAINRAALAVKANRVIPPESFIICLFPSGRLPTRAA
jgi:hypothetical protein